MVLSIRYALFIADKFQTLGKDYSNHYYIPNSFRGNTMIIKFSFFAIILLAMKLQQAYAQTVPSEDLCKALPSYLKSGVTPEELKGQFSVRPAGDEAQVLKLYEDLHKKFQSSKDTSVINKLCEDYFAGNKKPQFYRELKKLPPVKVTLNYNETMAKAPSIVIPKPAQMGFNHANVHCDKQKPQGPQNCGEIDPQSMGLPKNFVELEQIYSWRSEGHADRFSQESCYCLQKKNTKEKLNTKSIEESKKNINDLILKNAATNILNDYSTQFENVNFYLTNYPDVLKDDRSDPGQQAQLLCNDPALVEDKINERCKEYGTASNQREERLKALFDSKISNSANPTIKDYMQSLDSDIFNVVKAGAGEKSSVGSTMLKEEHTINNQMRSKDKNLTRRNYDQVRFTYINSQPDTVFIDTMLKHLMRDPKFEDLMTDKVYVGKLPPHLVLKGIFEENSKSLEMKRVLEKSKDDLKLLPIFQKDTNVLDNFFDRLKDPNEFDKVLNRGMNNHSGLKMILSSKDLFEAIEKGNRDGGSFLSFMEKDKEDLIDHLDTGCQVLRDKIADFVCTKDDKIISKTNRFELKEIIAKADKLLGEPDIIDLAVCSETDPMTKNARGAFSELDLSMRPIISDYTLKKRSDKPEELPVVMTLKNLESDKDLQEYTLAANTSLRDPESRYSLSDFSTPGGGGFQHLRSDRNFSIGDGSIDQFSPHRKLGSTPESLSGSGSVSETSIAPVGRSEEVSSANHSNNVTQTFQQNIQNQLPTGMQSQLQNHMPAPVIQPSQVSREIASEDELNLPQAPQSASPQSLSSAKQGLMDLLDPRSQNKEIKEHFSAISDKDARELVRLREEREADKKTISDLQLAAEKKETERLRKEYEDLDQKYQTLLKGQSSGQISGNGLNGGIDKLGGSTLTPNGTELSDDKAAQGTNSGPLNFNPSKTGQNVIADPRISKMGNEKGAITVDLRQNEGKDREEEVYKIIESTEDNKILEEIQKSGMTYMYKVVEGDQVKEIVETIAFKNLNPKLQELVLKKLDKKQQVSLVELQLKDAKRKFAAQALRLELLLLDHQAKRRTH